MTHVFNDPAAFSEEALEGFTALYPHIVRPVVGGVISTNYARDGRVAVVVGGGSGHYPMFNGLVGAGLADGAVVGNIFTSPSAQYAYSVAKKANRGGGVVFCYGNYAGDVINFGIAQERLRAEGIPATSVIVSDDVLSAPPSEREKRRGLAGDFIVLRALAGAASRGLSFDEVVAAGELSNSLTRTVGVAFGGCTFPGADHPLFEVPDGKMSIGLGVHGEPGLEDIDSIPSRELAKVLFDHISADVPEGASDRVAVIVNGLGATKSEELFVLWRDLIPLFAERGWTPVEPEVGEIITSLDMRGLSLTINWLTPELEDYWRDAAYGTGYRKGAVQLSDSAVDQIDDAEEELLEVPPTTAASQEAAGLALTKLDAVLGEIRGAESRLADADAIAGDGDHGRGMVRGVEAAHQAAVVAVERGAGLGTTLAGAGDAWAEHAGGTSGVLWGAAVRQFGMVLGDQEVPGGPELAAAAQAFADTIATLGKVQVGDKTMFDAISPTVSEFAAQIAAGAAVGDAVDAAARVAGQAADATAELRPKVGRARPLAEKSLGHPDPGALSFALIVATLAGLVTPAGSAAPAGSETPAGSATPADAESSAAPAAVPQERSDES